MTIGERIAATISLQTSRSQLAVEIDAAIKHEMDMALHAKMKEVTAYYLPVLRDFLKATDTMAGATISACHSRAKELGVK